MPNRTAFDVAAHVLAHGAQTGNPLNNAQLQCILYLLQCDWLHRLEEPLFPDDFEAWPRGPVVRDVHATYSLYGSMPVLLPARREMPSLLGAFGRRFLPLDAAAARAVEAALERRARLRPWQLARIACRPGGAWAATYNAGQGLNAIVPQELMARLDGPHTEGGGL